MNKWEKICENINNSASIVNASSRWSFYYSIDFYWTFAIYSPYCVDWHSSFPLHNSDFWSINKTRVPSAISFPLAPALSSISDAKPQPPSPSSHSSPLSSWASACTTPSAPPLPPASSSSTRRYSWSSRSCAARTWRSITSIRILSASKATSVALRGFACLRLCCMWKGKAEASRA